MRELAIQKLKELGINPNVIKKYDEPHRFYHNWTHIQSLIDIAITRKIFSDELFLAIVFHDIVYDPRATDNEERSVEMYKSFCKKDIPEVSQAILDTKTHKPQNNISKHLCDLDLGILHSPFSVLMNYEQKIFKEFQFVDLKTYIEKRCEILVNYGVSPDFIDYVRYRKYNIGLYAGSFNPFHKGHYNILKKAEKIFDKVILAKGHNPEKELSKFIFPDKVKFHQCVNYNGLLTDFMDSIGYETTLIRGLRNSTDLQYELTQYRFLQDLKPDIKTVSIFCDKEYEHISSSAIRSLIPFEKENNYLL